MKRARWRRFALAAASAIAWVLGQGPGQAADPQKVLRVTFQAAETGFDPVKVSDYYSGTIIGAIFDPLLTYDYLARPARIVPNVVRALPEVSEGGRVYTLRIRPGIFFAPDPVFKGARRELVARDFDYSIRRFLDPRNRSPYAFLFEGKIDGLDALAERAKQGGKFDYDAPVAGLQVPDRHTLRIRLRDPDPNFSHLLAFPLAGAVAREAIEFYGDESMAHPVGTGPYMLTRYVRSSKMVLEANPAFRQLPWSADPAADPASRDIAARMKGRLIPRIGRVEVSVMDEAQSRWLAFLRGETDIEYQLSELAPTFMREDGALRPEYAGRFRLDRSVDPEVTYTFFNVAERIGNEPNPVGGFSREKIALRRAIAMAYKVEDQIRIIRNGQAVRAHFPVPPGVAGHDPAYRSSIRYDPAAANALLDRYGYRRGVDGYRSLPDGSPLVIRYSSTPTERDRQFDELFKRSLDSIGIRMVVHKDRFPELIKLANQCRLMMRGAAWIADYPDGDNFMQLLYGPNTGQTNYSCYRSEAFDRRYERSRLLPDGRERDRLYREMTRLLELDTAWILGDSRYRNVLLQPRVVGYRKHPVLHAEWLYIDLEDAPLGRR